MKQIFTSTILFVLSLLTAWAQNPFEAPLKDFKPVATENIQNYDRLDSLYYLHTNTYALPYQSKKEMKKADALIQRTTETYQALLPTKSWGFFSSTSLTENLQPATTKILSIYYNEDLPSYEINGSDHNYAILGQVAPNPTYRLIHCVEWWLDKDKVYFKTASIFGPKSARDFQKLLVQKYPHLGNTGGSHTTESLPQPLQGQWASTIQGKGNPKDILEEYTVQSIQILCNTYEGNNSSADNAIVELVIERFLSYLTSSKRTDEGMVRVLSEIDLPGFLAEIHGANEVTRYPLSELSKHWKALSSKIFCISYEQKGSEACKKYGDISKNFLLQIYLE